MTTPFELLFGMKARTPSFPSQDVQHLHYGESFAAERLQILKQARLIAQQHTADKGEGYKLQFDKTAQPHDFKVGDLVLFSEHNFLGKNKKLALNGWARLQSLRPRKLMSKSSVLTTKLNC